MRGVGQGLSSTRPRDLKQRANSLHHVLDQRFSRGSLGESLGARKHGREVAFVRTIGLVDVADPNIRVVGIQQICAMWRTVHPPIKGGLRRSTASRINILAHPRPTVSLRAYALSDAGPIRTGVREKAITGHVGAVAPRSRLELTLGAIWGQTLTLSLRIDQGN